MRATAITFVAPDEETDLRGIERAISKLLPRVILPDFDYSHRPIEKLEIPIRDRIAAIRARKAEDRARAAANAQRRAHRPAAGPPRPAAHPSRRRRRR